MHLVIWIMGNTHKRRESKRWVILTTINYWLLIQSHFYKRYSTSLEHILSAVGFKSKWSSLRLFFTGYHWLISFHKQHYNSESLAGLCDHELIYWHAASRSAAEHDARFLSPVSRAQNVTFIKKCALTFFYQNKSSFLSLDIFMQTTFLINCHCGTNLPKWTN